MRKSWKIMGFIAGVAGVASLVLLVRIQGPKHRGLHASDWLQHIVQGEPQKVKDACQAFAAMGTDAHPYLSKSLRKRDSAFKRWLMRLDSRIEFIQIEWVRDDRWRNATAQALTAAGTNSIPLMPEFMEAFYDTSVPLNPSWATAFLVAMGPAGLKDTARSLINHHKQKNARDQFVLAAWVQIFDRQDIPQAWRSTVLDSLVAVMQNPHQESETVFACRLARLFPGKDSPVVSPLLKLLHDSGHQVRLASLTTLQHLELPAEELAPPLIALLHDRHPHVRGTAIQALPSLGTHGHRAISLLGKLLREDPAESVRLAALRALGNMEEASSGQTRDIAITLKEAPTSLRAHAARILILVQHDEKVTVPLLEQALQDEAWEVRCNAAESLGKLGSRAADAVPALAKMLKDSRESAQIAAVEALGRMGPAAASVIPDLYLAWNNNQSALGPYVKRAMQEIRGLEGP